MLLYFVHCGTAKILIYTMRQGCHFMWTEYGVSSKLNMWCQMFCALLLCSCVPVLCLRNLLFEVQFF